MEELVKDAQNGNELAFRKLIEMLQNDLYRVAKTRLKNDEDIKDAIQNTMIITYKNIKKVRNIEAFKAWTIKILINECNKIYNSYKKNKMAFDKAMNGLDGNLFDESIFNVQSKMDFNEFISKLDYDEQLIITLYYNSQLSCSQIARIINANVHTVKSKLNRSKIKLKEMNKEDIKNGL